MTKTQKQEHFKRCDNATSLIERYRTSIPNCNLSHYDNEMLHWLRLMVEKPLDYKQISESIWIRIQWMQKHDISRTDKYPPKSYLIEF